MKYFMREAKNRTRKTWKRRIIDFFTVPQGF